MAEQTGTPAGSAPGVGNPPVGTAPAQGQGQPGSEGFWNLFPNVPQEHRPLLEPHIREVQGHVTKLEEQLAPFKTMVNAGLTPQAAEGLVKFSADFERNPLDMWIRMGRMLQTDYAGRGPAVDPEVDIDYLEALAKGEDPDAVFLQDPQGGMPGQEPQVPGGQASPEVMQYIAQLQGQVETLANELRTDRAQRQETIQDRLLDSQLETMKTALTEAGWPEDLLNEQELYARLITSGGNVQAAITSMVDVRGGLLKGFTQNNNQQPGELNMPNGAPPTPPRQPAAKDSWGKARQNATARLARENQATAQQH